MAKSKRKRYTSPLTFNFDRTVIERLRDKSPDQADMIQDHVIIIGKTSQRVSSWNQYLSCLTRIDETLEYINVLRLGKPKIPLQAFDFYEFLMNCDIVVKSIETLANMFKVDYKQTIYNSNECFGGAIFADGYDEKNRKTIESIKVDFENLSNGNDGRFWEYLRSISTVHPVNTTRSNFIDNVAENYLHTSPYVLWNHNNVIAQLTNLSNMNIEVVIWKGSHDSFNAHVYLDTSMIQKYVDKWILLLLDIEIKIDALILIKKDELKTQYIKTIEDFNYDWEKYLDNIKDEYTRRYNKNSIDDSVEYFFTRHIIKSFKTIFDEENKQMILIKYNGLLKKEILAFHEDLQNMTIENHSPLHYSYYFENFNTVVKNNNLHYEFEKLDYIHDVHTEDPNIKFEPSDKILELYDALDEIHSLPNEIQKQYFINLRIPEPCTDAEWGRTMAIRINELLVKEWFPVNYKLNDWKVYLQIVLAFFVKSDLYKED